MVLKKAGAPPYYLSIARDIAFRVVTGEFKEGQRIYGRSVMASEYNTSPETIRRALKLLDEMKVVEVKPQSGVIALSRDNASRYISNFEYDTSVHAMLSQLQDLRAQYDELNDKIIGMVSSIVHSRYSFSAANESLLNFEVSIPNGSWLIGKSIGELKFWQSTGATIAAIRRGKNLILSPGPYAELYNGDVIILVGTPAAAESADRLVSDKGEIHDTV